MKSVKKTSAGFLITEDNERIAYCRYQRGHDKVIIIAHGFYNSKDAAVLRRLAEALAEDYDVFMFDFRGHGKSSGLFAWMSRENRDLAAVFGYLDGRYQKKGVIGFSLGGSICINALAKQEKADSLICVSSPGEFEKIDYHFWKLDWKNDLFYVLADAAGRKGKGIRPGKFWLKKDKPADNISRLSIPVLFIHGEKDWVIKPWHSRQLYEKTVSRKKLIIIKNGAHAEFLARDFFERFTREVKAWFRETLSVSCAPGGKPQ